MWHPCIQGCDPGRQAGGGRFVSGYNPEEHRSKQRQNRRFRLRRAESGGLSGQGDAQYVTEGEVVKTFKAMVEKMFSGAATAKGALIIANGIVERKSYDEIPPRVEYSLTEKGASVVPILQSICQWAGVFYKDGGETPMIQCQKCDHRG